MSYLYGLKRGIPIMLGYLAVSFSFGIMAVNECHLTPLASIMMSLTNVTSSGQYAGAKMIFENLSILAIGLTVLLINIRYFLMSLSLSQKLDPNTGTIKRLLFSFGITDEVYAMAITEKNRVTASYMFGLITLPILGWTLGTTLGALAGTFIPDDKLISAFGIALYAMFIAIIIPDARKSKPIFLVILIASAISCAFYYIPGIKEIGLGFKIIIATIVASIIGAIFFPIQDDLEDPEVEFKAKSGDLDV